MEFSSKYKGITIYYKLKQKITMSIKSVHLSLATDHSGLNIRVNCNAHSLSLFGRSDVASTLFTTGLVRSYWLTDHQSLMYISHRYPEQ